MTTGAHRNDNQLRLLLVEDNVKDCELLLATLRRGGYVVDYKRVSDPDAMKAALRSGEYDLVVSDHNLRNWNGREVLEHVRAMGLDLPVLIVTATLGDEDAAEYIKQGASDYILKDRLGRLPTAVAHALREKSRRMEAARLRHETERATQALRIREEQLRLLLNSTAEGIWGVDLQGKCTFCNPAALKLLGYSSLDQVLGKDMHDLVHHSRADGTPYPKSECPIYYALQSGTGTRVSDEVLWRADGSSFNAEYFCYPILKDGQAVGSVVTFFDVSERKRAEEQLKTSESTHRLLFQSNPHPMYVTDVETLRFLDVNEAAIRHYGYSREEFLSMKATDIRPSEDVPPLLEALARVNKNSSVHKVGVWRHRKKDGSYVEMDIAVHRFNFRGRMAVLAAATDVTEQRRLEQQLRQAQKMEAVGRLAGGIAHDFNNLMMIVTSYAQLLLEKKPEPPMRRYAENILDAGKKAADVTRQLLAFSRKQILQPTIVDINDLIRELNKMLPRLLGADIEMVLRLQPDLWHVQADSGQIEQVIMNIAINARDAMPDGGKLIVETRNVELHHSYTLEQTTVQSGSYVVLSMTDTGIGMDSETKNRVFEPFFTTKAVGKGTGLGLATVYGIVKQSSGYIWVDSDLGRGSTFTVYLPSVAENVAEMGATEPATAELPGGTETILLIEDEPGLRAAAREFLELKGYTVLEAGSGTEAVRLANDYRLPIQVILSDLVMPGMSGTEAVKEIKQRHANARVVYMSGYSDRALGPDVMADGAIFIQKPFSLDSLAQKLADCMSSTR
jgi:PAS domain S-box-containing protein